MQFIAQSQNMATKNGKLDTNTTATSVPEVAPVDTTESRRKQIEKFGDPAYNQPISRSPIAQIINAQDPSKVGLFIKDNALDTIGWKGNPPNHKHLFGGEKEENGVLIQSPRLNIIQVSKRFIELRSDDNGAKAGTLLNAIFESKEGYEFYEANKDKYALRRFYFVFVLDENNENLHEIPIAISIKGVASTKFGLALEEFRSNVETAFAKFMGVKNNHKNDEFHRLCVFNPTFVPSHEPKTEKNSNKRSWVAIVDSFGVPSPDGSDFLNYFCENKEEFYNDLVATNPDLSLNVGRISAIVQEHNRQVLNSNAIALLPPGGVIDVDDLNEPPY